LACRIGLDSMNWRLMRGVSALTLLVLFNPMTAPQIHAQSQDETLQEYIGFLEEVYQKMNENYFQPVSRERFDQFIETFKTKIYAQLKDTGKSIDFIRWRSANLMVEKLRDPQDIFSTFYPPKPAKEYEETALGIRFDLGIEGNLTDEGFVTSKVEPRSDAYAHDMRPGDIILQIAKAKVNKLTQEEIVELLTPLEGSEVKIKFKDMDKNQVRDILVKSQEYFKQTVFLVPTKAPGVFCLKIERFNRKTGEDLTVHLKFIKEHAPVNGLILDLRGNPGGPPLAAREIASFFLPGGSEFAYFQKRDQPKASLDVPTIPEPFKYDGPIAILVDEKSGSSSELFSGILQKQKRAVLIGQNTAGQVFLKSMFHFDDESMLLLVTARGHHPDGSVFSFEGLTPDRRIEEAESADPIDLASAYFYYLSRQ
jgi:carboxyl-terminal processing protease